MRTNHSHRHTSQLSLFQKAKVLPQSRIRVDALRGESHLIHFLIAALVACIAAYLYFVGLSIMNVISNREASVESDQLKSTVSTLEQEYFKLSNAVTLDQAAAHGLSAAKTQAFVRRDGAMASNVRANEI